MNEFLVSEVSADPYTIVPNYIINDPAWLLATKMTWIYIFSKRHIPGWRVRPAYMQKVMGYSDKIWRKVSKQLSDGGYLKFNKTKEGTVITFIYDWKFIQQRENFHLVDKSVD